MYVKFGDYMQKFIIMWVVNKLFFTIIAAKKGPRIPDITNYFSKLFLLYSMVPAKSGSKKSELLGIYWVNSISFLHKHWH